MTKGETIRKIRLERGLTQKQLGALCNIDEANIRRYELGKANPKLETLEKIAKALGSSVNELIEGDWEDVDLLYDSKIHPKPRYYDIENKLRLLGCSIQGDASEGYLYIKFPDGELDVTDEVLDRLNDELDGFFKFKLLELRNTLSKDFRPNKMSDGNFFFFFDEVKPQDK